MNPVLENIKSTLTQNYEFVGTGTDSKGVSFFFENYSHVIQTLPTMLEELKKAFPSFSFSNITGSYYLVAFNKPK